MPDVQSLRRTQSGYANSCRMYNLARMRFTNRNMTVMNGDSALRKFFIETCNPYESSCILREIDKNQEANCTDYVIASPYWHYRILNNEIVYCDFAISVNTNEFPREKWNYEITSFVPPKPPLEKPKLREELCVIARLRKALKL